MADSSYYQGDYIRHPVLYELSHKYGLQTESVPEAALPNKLEELKELIRREIRKELKIKEGAEKLREASKDRKSLSDVAHIVKKSNSKLSELQAELQELESQIILTQGQSDPLHTSNGHEGLVSPMSGLSVENQGNNNFSTDLRLVSLEKQLNIELKVKQGAENMLQSLASREHSRDKKLIAEAQQMLADSKAKIEYLKMRIMKARQNRSSGRFHDSPHNGDANNKDKIGRNLEPPGLEDRVDELRHRLRIEARVVEGAKNVIRLLQSNKVVDKKALQEPVARSPARVRGRSPLANKSTASSSEGLKTPRTVHIDVYCTGSDSESSSSSEEDSISSPQTVFESSNMKILHTRANGSQVPHALQRQKRQILSNSNVNTLVSPSGSQTNFSTAYPSARSSLVSGFDNFSIPSESTISSRSVANSSSVTTSWKDTDIESTRASLMENDSFEYDNALDKLRIKQKEKIWGEQANASLKKGMGFKNRSPSIVKRDNEDTSSSTSSDESDGLAWSFGRYADLEAKQGLKRENTVRRASNSQLSEVSVIGKQPTSLRKSGSLSDSEISPSGKKSYKISGKPPIKFEHWSKAQMFGPVVGSLKKPGHHVGPSKNPDCSCDTCRYFFEHVCYRNRTRSLGDNSS